ncbi:glycosyltransferase family 4 protein [Haloarcula japonica]|uniref:glycosyltransferase family 4 protein n=1 Tax=Haloarcula japonica TaxID=29282 RepID=UPI0039F6798E
MRILIVTPDYPPPPGGIQTLVRNLETGLEKSGHSPIVLQVNPDDFHPAFRDYVPDRIALSSTQILSPHWYPFFKNVHRRTIEAIKKHDPDIVHTAHIRMWPALQAANELGIPSVVSTHGVELSDKRTAGLAFEEATAVHTVSEFTGSLIQRDHAITPDAIIHPSIQLANYKPSDGPLESEDCVFCISRLVDRKNVSSVLEAWTRLDDEVQSTYRLDIAGTGPNLENIEKIGQNIDSVNILGRISEKQKVERMQKSSLFVLPAGGQGYDVEGFGIVYIEAQAAGTPVVGSTIGGVPEAVGSGGILLEDISAPENLAESIESLLTNEDDLHKYYKQSQERISNFDVATIAEEYVTLYKALA